MTHIVDACPECDSSKVRLWSNGKTHDPATTGAKYGCESCLARFETPKRRPAKIDGHSRHGLAKRLLDADPDEVGR